MSSDAPFKRWYRLLERIVFKETGWRNCGEIDQPFREWFEDGLTPQEAADLIFSDYEQTETRLRDCLC